MPFRMVVAPAHKRPNRRGRRVEHRDPVLLHDLPEAVLGRVVGRAFVHHASDAVGQDSVDDVAVPRHPTDVGRAPVDVVILEVEYQPRCVRRVDHVPGRGVHHALGLSGGSAGVQDVEGMLGGQLRGRADVGLSLGRVVPPHIAGVVPANVVATALEDNHALHRGAGAVGQRGVHVVLQRNHSTAPPAAIGGDDQAGAGIVDPVANSVRAEPAEHHAVHHAQARAGQHGHGQFGNHRHVQHHAVAGFQPLGFEPIGKSLHVGQQIGVGDGARVARFTFPVVGDPIAASGVDVPVKAVDGDVGLAVHKPLNERRRAFLQFRPWLEPSEPVGHLAPEALGVLQAAPVKLLIGLERRHARGRGEVRRGNECLALLRSLMRVLHRRHGSPSPVYRPSPSGTEAMDRP